MVLVSQQDVVKMNFNLERRECESVADFMRIYLLTLQMAYEYGFIAEVERDAIANAIFSAVRKVAQDDDVIISNYVYAISMRFLKSSNFECWELMREITSAEAAEKFVQETKTWFVEQIQRIMKVAKKGYRNAHQLKNTSIISTWKSCYGSLILISGCLEDGSKLELKDKHTESVMGEVLYLTLKGESGLTYVDKMENYIQNLWNETSILIKFDAGKIMKAISKERTRKKLPNSTQTIESLQAEYDQAVQQLADLDAFYQKKLQRIRESDSAYERILDKFEQEHPDMDEEEFDDAFDEYWMNSPEYCDEDLFDVEQEYHEKRIELQEVVNICCRKVDMARDGQADLENALSQVRGEVTLKDILEEYAIVELFKRGEIEYPQSVKEKMALLPKIPMKTAVEFFLENEAEKIHLTAEEMAYLS